MKKIFATLLLLLTLLFNYHSIQATDKPIVAKKQGQSLTPITQANIRTAVNEWIEDPVTAEAKYGHIKDWDVSNITSMSSLFRNKATFNEDISAWDVSNVSSLHGIFHGASSFNQDIGKWDVSKVTNMTTVFYEAISFNQDIGDWDVSNVTRMTAMFYNASNFNQDISNWNVTKVTRMNFMFRGANSFNQDIGDWDMFNVTDTSAMFASAKSFNQDLNNWNVTGVIRMSSMFNGATNFNQDISSWDVSNVTNMFSMFKDASTFNQDVGSWDVSNVTTMSFMFRGASSFNQDLGKWCVFNITTEPQDFALDTPLEDANNPVWGNCNIVDIKTEDVGSITESSANLSGAISSTTETIIERGFIYSSSLKTIIPEIGKDGVFKVVVGDDIGVFDSTISNLDQGTFYYYRAYASTVSGISYGKILNFKTSGKLPSITQENIRGAVNLWVADVTIAEATFGHIKDWDVSQVTDMSELFRNKGAFNEDISGWDVSNVTNMSSMFEIASGFNQDISNWNVSRVTNMSRMFSSATIFNQPIGIWEVSEVSDISEMFSYASNFNQDLSNWDVSSVTNMESMFEGARNFNQNVSNWNVSRVTNMSNMFSSAINFNQSLGNWDVSKVLNMFGMFFNAKAFNQDISTWCVTKIFSVPSSFSFNSALEDINMPVWGTCVIAKVTTKEATSITENTVSVGGKITFTKDPILEKGVIYINKEQNKTPVIGTEGVNKIISDTTDKVYAIEINNLDQGTNYAYRAYVITASGNTYGEVLEFKTLGVKLITQENIKKVVGEWFLNPTATETKYGHIKDWDVSNVTDMNNLFRGRRNFNEDLSNWDVSNVTNMSIMFFDAISFNQDLSNWDVSKVKNMSSMFGLATNFNQDIGNWDVSNVIDMVGMFSGAISFNQDISRWNVSSVTGMSEMFYGARSFNKDLSSWCVSKINSEPFSFSRSSLLESKNKPVWGTCPTLSIAELEDSKTIQIYQSNLNELTISGILNNKEIKIELFDMLGKQVRVYEIESTETIINFQLDNLKSGLYVLRLKNKTITKTEKLFLN